MDVFSREHVGSRAPRLAWRGTAARDFRRHAAEVTGYLAAQMVGQPETLAPLTAERMHLASFGRASDSLSVALGYSRKVTVRPDAAGRSRTGHQRPLM